MHRYRDLRFWQKSQELVIGIYRVTSKFPESERYGLSNQMRRSSVSIPSNIAEGSSRRSNKEFKRYLDIATGSAYELETQLLIASELDYLEQETFSEYSKELSSVIQMMSKFKSSLS